MITIRNDSLQVKGFYLGLLALTVSAVLFGLKVRTGLQFFEFVDETEKFVAAQMISQGWHLYKDVFAHHGPVQYMLAHLYTTTVSASDFSLIRLEIALLALASCLSVAFSPIFRCATARILAAAIYLFLLSSVWLLQGIHMLLYQSVGGFLFVIVLAQMTLPAIIGEQVTKPGLFISGFSLILSFFSAYSFGPAILLLSISSLVALSCDKESIYKNAIYITAGILAATTITMTWLFFYGDLFGYLTYHVYFNQIIYSKFIDFSPWSILKNFTISINPASIPKTLATILMPLWIIMLYKITRKKEDNNKIFKIKSISIAILAISIPLLNPRGMEGFHSNGYQLINLAATAMIISWLLQNSISQNSLKHLIRYLATLSTLVFVVIAVAKITEKDLIFSTNNKSELKKNDDDFYDFIRFIAEKQDGVLSLIFNPSFYIKADRLPASGNFYYLPWQAAYNKSPVSNYKIDICNDISENKPPIILFNNEKVWGYYSIDTYEPCVPEKILKNYTKTKENESLYIRNDIQENLNISKEEEHFQTSLSHILDENNPIRLRLLSPSIDNNEKIKEIGVKFGTYTKKNKGDAALRLRTQAGHETVYKFQLMELNDNKYYYFDIKPNSYTSGDIISISGSGVSTYESRGSISGSYTCIRYVYESGKKRLTPGCPLF